MGSNSIQAWISFKALISQLLKVSANPKLTVLNNFEVLYSLINIRNSFRLQRIHKKMLFVREVISENNCAILIYSNLPLTTLVIALSNKERSRDS